VSQRVLLVEDDHGTCELLEEALAERSFEEILHIEHGVESGWEFLRRESTSLPALILLDLKLPSSSGLLLLNRLRSDRRLSRIPVVIMTNSDDPQDIAAAYASGANAYVVKPGIFADLVRLAGDLCQFWLAWNRIPS